MGLDLSRRWKGGTMNIKKRILRGLAWMVIAMFVIPLGVSAQDIGELVETDNFRSEELDQMLAPIALYPDTLIAQILMASTYPLEVVQAERWVKQNRTLSGEALDDALKGKSWDPSIKSLCHFPDVLFAMSENLDRTRNLGDAFLNQQDDVLATIQDLRQKAVKLGNLKTTGEQNVIKEADAIRIEPADRQVIYVPVYDPFYVYGPWWYPAYPPHYWYYPAYASVTGGWISFGPRFFIHIDLFSWIRFDWHRHHIYYDAHKARRFHTFPARHDSNRYVWQHNPVHRKGIAYRNLRVRERFVQKPSRPATTGSIVRGYTAVSNIKRPSEPSKDRIKRRETADQRRTYRQRESIQRPEQLKRRETADQRRTYRQRESIQRPEQRRKTDRTVKASPEREPSKIRDRRATRSSGSGGGQLPSRASNGESQRRKSQNTTPTDKNVLQQNSGFLRQETRRPIGNQGVGRLGQSFFR